MAKKLTTTDHSRDVAGLKYVYPVISRRAGGLSIGINFNVNNACNWRCVYCQVPDLVRGSAPDIDLQLLESELRFLLDQVLRGDFFVQYNVPEHQRVIKDIAISGNGEPASLKNFAEAVQCIAEVATELNVLPGSDFVLITNGSLIHKQNVQQGLKILNDYHGQVWFKLDSATEQGRQNINDTKQSDAQTLKNLMLCATLCETRIQTCMVDYLTAEQQTVEQNAYLELLQQVRSEHLNKIMLYTIARPSLQPEADRVKNVDVKLMEDFASQLRGIGYQVSVSG